MTMRLRTCDHKAKIQRGTRGSKRVKEEHQESRGPEAKRMEEKKMAMKPAVTVMVPMGCERMSVKEGTRNSLGAEVPRMKKMKMSWNLWYILVLKAGNEARTTCHPENIQRVPGLCGYWDLKKKTLPKFG